MGYFGKCLLVLVLLCLVVTPVSAGKPRKIDICHITGESDFGSGMEPIGHVISIPKTAYKAHIRHGDPPKNQWTMVDLPDGSTFCKWKVQCPVYSVRVLRKDLAIYERELGEESVCYNVTTIQPAAWMITRFTFYPPDCDPSTWECSGWSAEAGYIYDHMSVPPQPEYFAGSHDYYGPPPQTRHAWGITEEEMDTCRAALLEFTDPFDCIRFSPDI